MRKIRTYRTLALVVVLALVLAVLGSIGPAVVGASSVTPTPVPGNPQACPEGCGNQYYKIDPPSSGTYEIDDTHTVTITTDGTYFDWSSTIGIDCVIVKGGPDANVYHYDEETFGDTGLHSPINPQNLTPYGLSHISFCFDYELDVSKTAETTYTRTYQWRIEKAVDPAAWVLFAGQSGTSTYTVDVTRTGYEDSGWAVTGQIVIHNPAPFAATIESIDDVISGEPPISATPDCGVEFPYTLPAGETLTCSYSAELPNGDGRTNTVTVTTSGDVGGGSASHDVTFGDPDTVVNGTVHVTDTNGESWSFSDTGSQTYDRVFDCADCDYGDDHHCQYQHMNTATIEETGASDTATVTVDCYELDVRKDAGTSYTRTYQWGIDKSVTPDSWGLFDGDTGTSLYTIEVTQTGYEDSGWAVAGTITVCNPAPIDAPITGISDIVSDGIVAAVECPVEFPYDLPSGLCLECTYSTGLPDASTRTNAATVTIEGSSNTFSGEAPVVFGDPTAIVDDTIHVTDTNVDGDPWEFTGSDSVSYEKAFDCVDCDYDDDQHCQHEHANTATIEETGASDTVTVTVDCYQLDVSKTAATEFTRQYFWEIAKTGSTSTLTLSAGQYYETVDYVVTVDLDRSDPHPDGYTDSGWAVAGSISIYNPASMPATIESIDDVISGEPPISATPDCGIEFPYTLPAGETLTCSYSAELPNGDERTNTATATLQNHDYDWEDPATLAGTTAFSGSKEVTWSDPTYEIDECLNASDTFHGHLGTVCYGITSLPKQYTYSREIGGYDYCGSYTEPNTASFITNDNGFEDAASWVVTVDVPCEGCTLTPGYWKTHSSYGPAAHPDDTWYLLDGVLGPDTLFFDSDQTYYQVLWTSPTGGNPYYILAHQYIAAVLNRLNGASAPPEVLEALASAESLFGEYTPDQAAAIKGRYAKEVRASFISLAGTLGAYNEGLIGPGHCDE